MYTHTDKPHREERAPWRGESVYGQPTAYDVHMIKTLVRETRCHYALAEHAYFTSDRHYDTAFYAILVETEKKLHTREQGCGPSKA